MVEPVPELDGIPGGGALEAGEPDPTPGFTPLEEVREGPVQAFENRIDHHRGQIGMLFAPVPLVLFIEMQVFARLLVVRNQLFQPLVVEFA